jgi:hypothetical protein
VLLKRKNAAALPLSWMPSMRSIPSMPASSAWMSVNFWCRSPTAGEQALEIADTLVRSGAVDVLVIDSVAALTPRAELEGEMGDQPAGASGPSDEPGAAQADRLDFEIPLHGDLHQPDPDEDWRYVRLARNHDRW